MKQYRITSEMFKTDLIPDCYIDPKDPIYNLIKQNTDNDRFISRIQESIAKKISDEKNENI